LINEISAGYLKLGFCLSPVLKNTYRHHTIYVAIHVYACGRNVIL